MPTETLEPETKPVTRVAWRTLTEQTGFRVLTLPSGETLSASDIAAVRFADDGIGVLGDVLSRRVIIDTKRQVDAFVIRDEPSAVFAVATAAHRMAQTEAGR